ncbi:MAG TPA: DUF4416 family protein [Terriglobales bacterium]|nr:DUF4416 family protein [Terriglobales bacterium]
MPAKYFVALLSSDRALLSAVEGDLASILGSVDGRSPISPWEISRYYENEMGTGLLRRFVSFSSLISPGKLAEIKLQAQQLETKYRGGQGGRNRRVNIDPGYCEASKIVLATTKNASHRIYLQSGIFAEPTLLYYKGGFRESVRTYPDYQWPETLCFFASLRSLYLKQLRQLGITAGRPAAEPE